jgi:hypothetical protein
MNTNAATELVRAISTLDQAVKELGLHRRALEIVLLRQNPDLRLLIEAEVEKLRKQESVPLNDVRFSTLREVLVRDAV